MTLLLLLANMLTFPLQAVAKLPSTTVRRAVSQAIRAGDANGLAAVLERHGLQVNAVIGAEGYTLLHDAVVEGTPEVVTYLLANDAQVNATNQYGVTPLDEAKAFAKTEMVALLEQAGAVHGEGFHLSAVPTVHGNAVGTASDALTAHIEGVGLAGSSLVNMSLSLSLALPLGDIGSIRVGDGSIQPEVTHVTRSHLRQ